MKTFRKVTALILAVLMLASTLVLFSSCGKVTDENPGAVIDMYLPYTVSLDPAVAYADEASATLISLMYEGLTTISANGKLELALAKSWETYIDRDGNKMLEIQLNTTRWSDGTTVSSSHFIDAWERILDPAFNCQAASLLYPIKNAAAVNVGDMTLSDLGVGSANPRTLTIMLEDWADPEAFMRNCASVALYPVRKDVINKIYDKENQKENDWSTLIAIMVTNGPFYLKGVSFGNSEEGVSARPYMVLERNINYYLDPEKNESLDKFVTPYRINVNMTYGNDDLQAQVENRFKVVGTPAKIASTVEAIRATLTEEEIAALGETIETVLNERAVAQIKAEIKDQLSGNFVSSLLETIRTNKGDFLTYYKEGKMLLNASLPLADEEALETEKAPTMVTGTFLFNTTNELFSDAKVRQALSMVLDREEIASMVKYASAADTLITSGVFETNRKTSFKENAGYGLATTADDAAVSAAKALLKQAGVTKGSFTITVRATEADIMIAQYAQQAWKALGFTVDIQILGYAVTTYSKKQLVTSTNDAGEVVKDWVDQVIYDGLLHDKYMDAYTERNFDVIFYDVNMLTTDAFPALAQFASMFSGSAYDFSDPENFDKIVPHVTGYLNSEYDTVMQQAMVETDVTKRAELLHKAEEILLGDLPVVPVIYYENAYVLSGNLKKLETNYFGAFEFSNLKYKGYVAQEEAPETEAPGTEAAE